jgi:acyl dehydratase
VNYADLHVGLAFRSPGRTITEADVVAFAGLTGDYSELHTSEVYGKASQFGRRVAHGMLGLAYAHGLMWPRTGELRETAVAFLGISDWRFVGPIFLGDTIFVNYTIAGLRDSGSKPTQAIAISPLLRGNSPATISISVLLPQPDGPTTDTNSPAAMSTLTSWSARNGLAVPSPKVFVTRSMRIGTPDLTASLIAWTPRRPRAAPSTRAAPSSRAARPRRPG